MFVFTITSAVAVVSVGIEALSHPATLLWLLLLSGVLIVLVCVYGGFHLARFLFRESHLSWRMLVRHIRGVYTTSPYNTLASSTMTPLPSEEGYKRFWKHL